MDSFRQLISNWVISIFFQAEKKFKKAYLSIFLRKILHRNCEILLVLFLCEKFEFCNNFIKISLLFEAKWVYTVSAGGKRISWACIAKLFQLMSDKYTQSGDDYAFDVFIYLFVEGAICLEASTAALFNYCCIFKLVCAASKDEIH